MAKHTDGAPPGAAPLQAGWRHLEAGRWEEAGAAFRAALAKGEAPEPLEGLSWAAWWTDDAETVLEARERALRLYREADRPAAAARMAIWLAVDHFDFRGAAAVAGGWLRRARRLLEGMDPGPEHGWLAFHEGYLAYMGGNVDRAEALAIRTVDAGRTQGVPDLEMLGLGLAGTVLVSRGEVERGLAFLDEAAAAAVAGEATLPISGAWACCFLVGACEKVRDYPRAFEWCREIEAFARRYGSRYMLGFCRTHYGVVHMYGGRWAEAEAALEEAVDAYARSRTAFVPEARAALAELRRRQGRLDEAERLLDEAGSGRTVLLCRAHLALDRGEALRAAELAERILRQVAGERPLDRVPALELLVAARAARGDVDSGGEALEELRTVTGSVDTPLLAAAREMAEGVLAAASGDHEAARPCLEDAGDRFRSCGAPFEAARAQLALARTLAALGRADAARHAVRTAWETFLELGAEGEAARARRLLDALAGDGRAPPLPELTRREREVLRLVARGLTNREVAGRLTISDHTVHRHVANILRKLHLPSRTAAASRAVREGLLDESPG